MEQQPVPNHRTSKVVGAVIGAVAALSIGGVGLAFAQEAEPPTTEPPTTVTPAPNGDRDDDCPHKDGDAAVDRAPEAAEV